MYQDFVIKYGYFPVVRLSIIFKNIMSKIIFLILVLWLPQLLAAQEKKPNVILIITDDQGYGDIAAHGNTIIKTPQMDKLHNESVRLTNFHSGTTCAPSRSGLMTGVEGNRAGVWHTIGGCNILREGFITMPEVFKAGGYSTAMFGKWHLGDAYPYLPENRGFDEALYHGAGGIGQTPDYWGNDYFDDTYFRNGTPEKFVGYCTDVFFREAIEFIEREKDSPFFIYLSTNAPHGPFNVEKSYYDLYSNETSISEKQKAFYGMITNIDDNLFILEQKLLELGLKDNTILIFTTDNGTATGIETYGDQILGYNAGMRGKKSSQYEGGHRVPFFIRWKDGNIEGGLDVSQLAMNFDVLPTLIDLCNLNNTQTTQLDGISLAPLLKNEVTDWPHRYCVVDNNRLQQPQKWHKCAVMDDDWRLINGKELYNIKDDIGQNNDVAAENQQKVIEMRKAYESWWDYTSEDFSHYEAYKIGVSNVDEHVITVHDLHTHDKIPWFQSHIRCPKKGNNRTLAQGFWMIDVVEEGVYEISLSRWPRESGLSFGSTIPALGVESGYYDKMPSGITLDIEKATLSIEGLNIQQDVDLNQTSITFKTRLSGGRKQMQAFFTDKDGAEFAAFYMYIKKL